MTKTNMDLAPLRDIDDFLLGSARFQLPNYKDLDKWSNRVVQNLLYYQTNYFLTGICLMLLVSIYNPLSIMYGSLGFLIILGSVAYFVNPTRSMSKFKNDYPAAGIILALVAVCLMYFLFSHLLVFLFAFLLPMSVTFIHASLRLRNLRNKISNIEREISAKTPMGALLEMLELLGAEINGNLFILTDWADAEDKQDNSKHILLPSI